MRLGAGGGGTRQADAAGRGPAAAGDAAGTAAGVGLGLLERDQVVAVGKADLLLGLLFVDFLLVRDVIVGGNAEARAALRALSRLALQAGRPVQPMTVRAKELDLLLGGGGGAAGLGTVVAAVFLRFFVLLPFRLWLRDAELGAALRALGGFARAIFRTMDLVTVGAEELNHHGSHPARGSEGIGPALILP